jgi:hypothetical protein
MKCGDRDISMLLDLGSTHNFISPELVIKQRLKINPKKGLKVILASKDFEV